LNSSTHYISKTSKNEQLIFSEILCLGRGKKIIMMDSIQSNSHVLPLTLFEQSAAIIWTQEGAKNKRMGEIACKAVVKFVLLTVCD
jgi:hypothetical protein